MIFFFLSETKKIILKKEQIQERKKRKQKEKKNQGKDERSFLHKYQGKTPNNRTLKTKETTSIFKLLKCKPQSNWVVECLEELL